MLPEVLLTEADAESYKGQCAGRRRILSVYARLSHLFDQGLNPAAGIHATAVIADDAEVDRSYSEWH